MAHPVPGLVHKLRIPSYSFTPPRVWPRRTRHRPQEPLAEKLDHKWERVVEKAVEKCCSVCGKTAADVGRAKLFVCPCELKPTYCSSACQKSAYKTHKAECTARKLGRGPKAKS